MTTTLLLAGALLLGARAGAAYYLDERFERMHFPPPGWRVVEDGSAGWYRVTGPPPNGAYAEGTAGVPEPPATSRAAGPDASLVSPPFTVPAAKTLYYRFIYVTMLTVRSPPYPLYAEFYICYADTGERLVDIILNPLQYIWEEASGSTTAAANRPIIAVWRATYGPPYPGWFLFKVDNCQLSDEDLTEVAPASLGRVKAIYR
jgi:hypothetical protein